MLKRLFPFLFILIAQAVAGQNLPGVVYSYYEGAFNTVPNFAKIKPVKYGTASNVTLTAADRTNGYALLFQSRLNVPTTGSYTFEIQSSDGAKLYIGSYSFTAAAVVNNDGIHTSPTTTTGSVYLKAGSYPLSVGYFVNASSPSLSIFWSGPGISRQLIPSNKLSYAPSQAYTGNQGGAVATTKYYFSSSQGNDSRTATQAQNSATPWKTLAKFQAVQATAAAGTAFLFKRGDVFESPTTTTVTASGITMSAYGVGPKPVFNGLKNLSGWQNMGGNVWRADLNAGATVSMVLVRNKIAAMGRYPNPDQPNGGYITTVGHNGFSAVFTNNAIVGNWVGGDINLRSSTWMINKYLIVYNDGSGLAYNGLQSEMIDEPIDGCGFFVTNHLNTLDQNNEWYYHPTQKKLYIYSTTNPGATVRAAYRDTLLRINPTTNNTVDNILFQGSNRQTVMVYQGSGHKFKNTDFNYNGFNALMTDQTTDVVADSFTIHYAGNNGLFLFPFSHHSVARNFYIDSVGMIPGTGQNSNYSMCAVIANGVGAKIEYGKAEWVGYNGMVTSGDSCSMLYNVVKNYCATVDDGSAFYTSLAGKGRKINFNIAINGIGNIDGSYEPVGLANSFGSDDLGEDIEFLYNTAYIASREGFGLHNTKTSRIQYNIVYKCQLRGISLADDVRGVDPCTNFAYLVRNNDISHNIFVSSASEPPSYLFQYYTGTNGIYNVDTRRGKDNVFNFGTSDFNFYAKPFGYDDYFKFSYQVLPEGTTVVHDTARWPCTNNTTAYDTDRVSNKVYEWMLPYDWKRYNPGKESNSVFSPTKYPAFNVTSTGPALFSNFGFNTAAFAGTAGTNASLSVQSAPAMGTGSALKATYTGINANGEGYSMTFYDNSNKTLTAGKTYKIKFDLKGDKDSAGTIRLAIYSATHPVQLPDGMSPYVKINNQQRHYEIDIVPPVTIPAYYLRFDLDRAIFAETMLFDNLQVNEVEQTKTNPDDYIKLYWNETKEVITQLIPGGIWKDAAGVSYAESVNIQPFRSILLFKQ